MRLIAKIAIAGIAVAGVGATMYAAPGGQLSARALELRSQTQGDFRHVLQLQAVARREKDVIKLNCVNDKLIQMKAELNVADRLQVDVQVSTQLGDPTGSMVALSQAANQIHMLREAADQCIGEHLLVTESSNTWTHPDIPDNPSFDNWGIAVEPPAYASPVN